jgi:hypothetical protein
MCQKGAGMRFIRNLIEKIMGLIIPREEKLKRQVAESIDLGDLVTQEFHLVIDDAGDLAEGFKIFESKDDYNREFLCVFQNFKSSFYLDYSHKDGHFRV